MARIDYADPAKASDRTREVLGKNRNANIFRMMSHSPSYFEQYCRLGNAIRFKGELDPIVRELAITRTGILCEAPYEVVAHKRIGKGVGVTDEQNAALDNWKQATCFNDDADAPRSPSPTRSSRMHKPTDATFNAIAAQTFAGGADRVAAVGRLLHHDVEVSGDVRRRYAAGRRWLPSRAGQKTYRQPDPMLRRAGKPTEVLAASPSKIGPAARAS